MKSNYDILGNHIRLIDTRNRESITDRVLGINIDKFFMPSVANVIGTDLSKYKLITKGKFACNPMHVGRDERLPVALYDEEEPAIVSPAYFMFEVVDNSILNEDYLMMWFRRPEFDRICWLHTDGSVRGGITWDDICRLELPIPPIEKQLEIVNSYKAITERIALKKKINDNLVACIDTIFNEQFGNFKALAESSTANTDFSSLPDGWTIENAVHSFDISIGKTPPRSEPEWFTSNQTDNVWISIADMKTNSPFIFKSAEYLTNEAVKKHNVKIVPANSVLLSFKMTVGRVAIVTNEVTTNEAIAHFPCTKENLFFVYCYLKNFNYGYLGSTSSITTAINSKIIKEMPFLMPSKKELDLFNHKVSGLFEQLKYISKELDILEELSKMLLPQLLGHC